MTLAVVPTGAQDHDSVEARTPPSYEGAAASETPSVDLSLGTDSDGPANVMLEFPSRFEKKLNFQNALSSALGCQVKDTDLSRDIKSQATLVYAKCDAPLRPSLFARVGSIDLHPFKDLQNTDANFALLVTLSVPKYDYARCDPAPDRLREQNPAVTTCLYFWQDPAHAAAAVRFEFGYSPARVTRVMAALGLLLLIPITCTFWFRRRTKDVADQTRPSVSFAYRRFLTWTALFGTLVWWAAVDLLHADEFVKFALPSWRWIDAFAATIVVWIVLWAPPLIVYFLCLVLSAPMQALRGAKTTQKQTISRSFWAVVRLAVPLLFICLGVIELFHAPRLFVLFVAAGIVAGKFANRHFARAYGIELHALSSGELRDRAFAMAQKAKTTLNQLYVMPAEHIRMANAFAHVAQNVFLTDYLVKNLSKAEVDAIVGHEIAHLREKHIGRRMALTLVAIFAFVFGAGFLESRLPRGLPKGPIFYAILLLVLLFVSRRNEFAADAGSVKLTGNAEAMITALARVTRLNTVPMQWGRLDEKLLTHPSTLRRIRRLARLGRVSEARTAELLNQSLAPPAETYPIPPSALPGGKLFSTRYKAQLAARFRWTVTLTTVVPPAIVAWLTSWARLGDGARWLAYVLGFLFILAANLAALNFLPLAGLPNLASLLREKRRADCPGSGEGSGLFVGLAPSSEPRVYEGNWSWDIGFLSLSDEHLSYWGEETRFALPRDEIISVSLGPGPTGWFRTPSVYVSWHNAQGQEGIFHLRPLAARSMREMAVQARVLARDLQNWHQRLSSAAAPIIRVVETVGEKSSCPSFGKVTGVAPQGLVRGAVLARDFLRNTFLAVAAILVFGLGVPRFDQPHNAADFFATNPAYGGLYVLVAVWLMRVFMLLPLWRNHKKTSSGKPAAAVAG